MNAFFYVNLNGLTVQTNEKKGIQFLDGVYLTNSYKNITANISEKDLLFSIGAVEVNSLFNSKAIFYKSEEVDDDCDRRKELLNFMYEVKLFLTGSWFYEDNGIHLDDAFMFSNHPSHGMITDKNNLGVRVRAAIETNDFITLNTKKLKVIRDSVKAIFGVMPREYIDSRDKLFSNSERISLALYHIQVARSQQDLPMRISFFISSLECIFNTESTELSHQVSERVSFFLAREFEERLKIYSFLKDMYKVRSYVFHGKSMKKTRRDVLLSKSGDLEFIVKKVFLKIIGDDNHINIILGKEEGLRSFFQELIFK
ncbi:MAG: hypothetical protein CME62_14940 [Halobacteriovoraceae bacterium]|nr:hypothetical protein [Halobacteriovoraceae bacterium]|tara:strand:+ start:5122 stop:6060 length:939 start_codon:yes stop_codon:yes gene_type:complete